MATPFTYEREGLTDYQRGFIDGMYLYAWHKDGVLYVGTTGRTYREAVRDFLTSGKTA